jgi:hypothetical protein
MPAARLAQPIPCYKPRMDRTTRRLAAAAIPLAVVASGVVAPPATADNLNVCTASDLAKGCMSVRSEGGSGPDVRKVTVWTKRWFGGGDGGVRIRLVGIDPDGRVRNSWGWWSLRPSSGEVAVCERLDPAAARQIHLWAHPCHHWPSGSTLRLEVDLAGNAVDTAQVKIK